MSADGTKVLFRTGVASNLPNVPDATTPTGQSAPSLTTAGGQLFLRDLAANTTTLVTRNPSDGSPAGGIPLAQPFAALSADGTTVAWSGQNASKQTRFLSAETPNDGTFLNYMWRRVADGPGAPTRRITGPVDLDDSGCTPALELLYDNRADSTGPCYGVLQGPEGDLVGGQLQSKAPVLSADGYRVAFLTGILPRGVNGSTQFDLYVTDMHPGVSRKAGTTQLTTHNLSAPDGATSNPIQSLAISADGRRLAFVTGRTTFLLPSPRLTDPPLPVPGTEELYVIDFDRSTIQLASRGLDGGGADQTIANTLSISGNGTKIAFVSGATNLFSGDANTKADAFVVTDTGSGCTAACSVAESSFSGYSWAPPRKGGGRVTKLKLSSSRSGARIRLQVKVPVPGTVSAIARAKLGMIARASASAARAGTTTLVLRPRMRFLKLIRRRGGVGAIVAVRFTPRNPGPILTAKHRVTFKG
jgi:hypothetical protein